MLDYKIIIDEFLYGINRDIHFNKTNFKLPIELNDKKISLNNNLICDLELFNNNDISKSTLAGMGASVVSDTVSHPFKVFKLLKQTDSKIYFNLNTAYRGFFLRLVVNGIQGGTYGFLWHRIDNFIKN